jgi:hypothetical protein
MPLFISRKFVNDNYTCRASATRSRCARRERTRAAPARAEPRTRSASARRDALCPAIAERGISTATADAHHTGDDSDADAACHPTPIHVAVRRGRARCPT